MMNGNGESSSDASSSENIAIQPTQSVIQPTQSTENCGKSFGTKQQLRRQNNHQNGKTKQFECSSCQRSFYLRIGLLNHYRISKCKPVGDFNQDD